MIDNERDKNTNRSLIVICTGIYIEEKKYENHTIGLAIEEHFT
jgi:hypothetical protein